MYARGSRGLLHTAALRGRSGVGSLHLDHGGARVGGVVIFLRMDDHIPVNGTQTHHGHHDGHQRHHKASHQEKPRYTGLLTGCAHRFSGGQHSLHQRAQKAIGIAFRNMLRPWRHHGARLILWQLGRNFRVDQNPANHIDQIQKSQEKAGEHGRRIQFHDRLTGHRCVNNDHHRRRNQNTQGTASRDHTRGQAHVIPGVEHRPHRNHAHQHHHCADQAACDTPEGTNNERGDSQ